MKDLEGFAAAGLDAVLTWASARGQPFGYERSARFASSGLCTERGLLSFSLRDGDAPAIRVVCQTMNAPPQFCDSITRFLSSAAFVHFGFERTLAGPIGKCYLELPVPKDRAGTRQNGQLRFLGFKWSMDDPSLAVVTKYRSVESLSWLDVEQRLIADVDGVFHDSIVQILRRIEPPKSGAANLLPTVLEISEEGSDRMSCDINVYNCGRTLNDVATELAELARVTGVPDRQFTTWHQEHADAELGHLAAGIDRQQSPFFTIYYGMTQVVPPSTRVTR